VVRLERDYRSTPQVVSLANRVIAAARGRMAGSKLHLIGQRPPGPEPSFSEHPDEVAEAASVARACKKLMEAGTPAAEIAVLYRINAQSEVYEEALTEAGIPFQVRGGEGFFSRQEIRQSLVALQKAADRGADGPVPEVVRGLLEPLGLTAEPPAGTKARDRWEALGALAELVDEEVALHPELDLAALVAELKLRADARHPPTVQGVTLASLHAAKGLEWDAVFLVGLADATLPISHAIAKGPDSEAVEEERRLLYVGITRARMHLELSWALARAPGGRQSRRPSRFLGGIAPQTRAEVSAPKSRHKRGATPRCRVCNSVLTSTPSIMLRRCETCSVDIDEDLLAQLKEWRLKTSKDLSVPAYVVFTDNTLIAIAESLPADEAALVAIPGIGSRKLEQFGADVLELVRARS
jgi:DNA helicase-2/ATP-dependent DNA helicase PcrA